MLVHIKEIVNWAKKNKCAIGAFNTYNLESTIGIVEGAQKMQKPIIIQVSETTIESTGVKPITHIVTTIAKNKAITVPVALHLDHGRNFSSIIECIDAGFSSVMIDASNLAFDENIKITKRVAQYAHRCRVWAQGEIGRVVKEASDIKKLKINPKEFLTDPEMALQFTKKTGVDTLAIAIGNVHGVYKMQTSVPKLYLDRLAEIHKIINKPLVLHGASGISAPEIKRAIKLGIKIINIDTELRIAFRTVLEESLKANRTYDPRKIMRPCIDAIAAVVAKKIKLFSS